MTEQAIVKSPWVIRSSVMDLVPAIERIAAVG
ncbi:unnamed protein product, partial [marine sediment metagenome]